MSRVRCILCSYLLNPYILSHNRIGNGLSSPARRNRPLRVVWVTEINTITGQIYQPSIASIHDNVKGRLGFFLDIADELALKCWNGEFSPIHVSRPRNTKQGRSILKFSKHEPIVLAACFEWAYVGYSPGIGWQQHLVPALSRSSAFGIDVYSFACLAQQCIGLRCRVWGGRRCCRACKNQQENGPAHDGGGMKDHTGRIAIELLEIIKR